MESSGVSPRDRRTRERLPFFLGRPPPNNSSVERRDAVIAILVTTNEPFAAWPTTFSERDAARVVTLVDRLMHRAEIVTIAGDSYLLREAEERRRERASARKRKKEAPKV
jgi:hypothetical protein